MHICLMASNMLIIIIIIIIIIISKLEAPYNACLVAFARRKSKVAKVSVNYNPGNFPDYLITVSIELS